MNPACRNTVRNGLLRPADIFRLQNKLDFRYEGGHPTIFDIMEVAIIGYVSCDITSKPVEPLPKGRQ